MERLQEVLANQSLPIKIAIWAQPKEASDLIAKWMHAGVPLEGLALHFDKDWIVANYIRWLFEMADWYRRSWYALTPGQQAIQQPFFRHYAGCFDDYRIRWDNQLPQMTYARRGLAELSLRVRVAEAVDRFYETHQEVRDANKRRPNNQRWERQHPEVPWWQSWAVEMFKPLNKGEKQMLDWREGDTWYDVLQRQIERLERTEGRAPA